MLMGSVCTRACRFCAVDTGNPNGWLDPEEPTNAAEAVRLMALRYIVLTSVDRDDLPDGGAAHYAACVRAIKAVNPTTADRSADARLQRRSRAPSKSSSIRGLQVFAQNIETVERLTHPVRDPRAGYERTLGVLAAREAPSRRRADEIELDARARRNRRGDLHDDGRSARARRRHPDARSIPAADAEPSRRSSVGCTPTSSRAIASGDSSAVSSKWRRGRWCVRAIAPIAFSRRTTSASPSASLNHPDQDAVTMASFADYRVVLRRRIRMRHSCTSCARPTTRRGAPNNPKAVRQWLASTHHRGDAGTIAWLPVDGATSAVLAVVGADALYAVGDLPFRLPAGDYRAGTLSDGVADLTVLGWGLGAYRYTRYKTAERAPARLVVPTIVQRRAAARSARSDRAGAGSDQRARLRHVAGTTRRRRDERSRKSSAQAATSSSATICSRENFPTIHAVGRASANAPRLIDLTLGQRRPIRASR